MNIHLSGISVVKLNRDVHEGPGVPVSYWAKAEGAGLLTVLKVPSHMRYDSNPRTARRPFQPMQ